jgi:hypothetical protein
MTVPADKFSQRTIVIAVLVLLVAVALTIAGTYLLLNTFVFDQNDPLAKAGGLSPEQERAQRTK